MPKNKTHSGTKKRIKVTGTGKLLRERAGKRHLLEKKSSHKTRELSGNDRGRAAGHRAHPAPARRSKRLSPPGPGRPTPDGSPPLPDQIEGRTTWHA